MSAPNAITPRDRIIRRRASLELERASWWHHWKSIQEVLMPRSGRFFIQDESNRGSRRNDILDDTGTAALTTLGAGMQSGMTSPARPWVRLETDDPDLMENANVSRWLDQVTTRILNVFARSNVYNSLHSMYEELGGFGTAASFVLPDYQDVIRCYPLTVGEYFLASNDRNEIDTLGRDFQMTVQQIVERFVVPRPMPGKDVKKSGTWDWSNVSPAVKNLWDAHNVDTWIPLYHLVDPRLDRDTRKLDAKNMPWRSAIIELAGPADKILNESGYKRFPVLAPRWIVTGNDTYGSNCPGMRALGGILQLQHEHKRKLQGIDFQVQPPIMVPTALKNQDSDFLPGGVTYYDPVGGKVDGVHSAWQVQLDLNHLLNDIQDIRQLIKSAFFADVFLSMEQIEGQPITAREVQERHEEKLLMLGPVVERQQSELLTPLVNITFDALMESGSLPPPPQELQGMDLKMEFVSVLAQAQRSTAMAGVDRWIGAVGSIAAAKQDASVWDNVNVDVVIQDAAGYLGVAPEMARGKDEIQALRDARNQAMQAQQKAAATQQAAETAKTLSQAPTDNSNALTQVINGFSGQGQPTTARLAG
jgi:hypothetical protein